MRRLENKKKLERDIRHDSRLHEAWREMEDERRQLAIQDEDTAAHMPRTEKAATTIRVRRVSKDEEIPPMSPSEAAMMKVVMIFVFPYTGNQHHGRTHNTFLNSVSTSLYSAILSKE